MKKWLVVIVLLFPFLAAGQNSKAQNLFNKGKIAYDSKDFNKAEKYFQKSIGTSGTELAYYYLGKTQLIKGDTCHACSSMLNSKIYGNADAATFYREECVTSDTIQYKAKSYYCVVTKWTCNKETEVEFFKRSSRAGSDTLVFLENDSALQNALFYTPDFDIEKYLAKHTGSKIVSDPPVFPGGEQALMVFLANNIRYPAYARDHNIQGTVYVRFVILKDGRVSFVRLKEGVGGGLDEEAVRVVKAMPDWIPGKADGKPVNIIFNIPIRFILR